MNPEITANAAICGRLLFEMEHPGILVTEVILTGDGTKCADGDRPLGLPPRYDEDWPLPNPGELRREGH